MIPGITAARLQSAPPAPPVTDPFFANVELLLHFDGVDGATATTDSSSRGRAITFNGGAQLDTAQAKWGPSSLLLDGTDDHLTIAHDTAFSVATGDFTIEAWIRINATGKTHTISNKRAGSGAQEHSFSVGTTQRLSFSMFSGGSVLNISDPGAITTGIWYHVAVARAGTLTRLFRDGVMVASGTQSGAPSSNSAPLLIGRDRFFSGSYFQGWIDDYRFTKGVARYTENFTPPAGPFPDAAP